MISWIEQGPAAPENGYDSVFNTSYTQGTSFASTQAVPASLTAVVGTASTLFSEEHGQSSFETHSAHSGDTNASSILSTILSLSDGTSLTQKSTSPTSNLLHGTTFSLTSEAIASHEITSLMQTITSIDSAGTTIISSTQTSESSIESFSSGLTSTITGHTISTAPITSTTISTSTTGTRNHVNTQGSTVTSSVFPNTDAPSSWQTTQTISTEFDFTSFTVSTGSEFTEWTTDSSTSTFSDDTFISSYTFATSTNYTKTWHYSTFETISTDTDGTSTITSTVTSSSSYAVTVVTDSGAKQAGFLDNTVIIADRCAQLYACTGITGVTDFCGAFTSTDKVTLSPMISTSDSISNTGSETQTSSTFATNTADNFTSQSTTAYTSSTEFNFTSHITADSSLSANAPIPLPELTASVFVPFLVPGYQPYTAMMVSDSVYSSYSISVASTETETSNLSTRSVGITYLNGPITQVMPASTNDTLEMLSAILPDSTTTATANGGFGGATGDNTISFSPGVFSITNYAPVGTTTGEYSSSTEVVTFTESSSSILPRGEIDAIAMLTYTVISAGTTATINSNFSAGDWPAGVTPIAVTEVNCSFTGTV